MSDDNPRINQCASCSFIRFKGPFDYKCKKGEDPDEKGFCYEYGDLEAGEDDEQSE